MNRVIKYFIENSFVVSLISIFIILVGLFSYKQMPVRLIPALEYQVVSIDVGLPGASAEELEKFVVYPIEDAIKGETGIENMKSRMGAGNASIDLVFHSSYRHKMSDVVENIKNNVENIRYKLPRSITDINIKQYKRSHEFLYYFIIENFDEDNKEHRTFYKKFETRLKKIPSVYLGWSNFRNNNLVVSFDQKKLKAMEISLPDARSIIYSSFRFNPVGQVNGNDFEYAVEVAKAASTIEDIKSIPLRSSRSGTVVPLRQVAKVSYKMKEQERVQRMNGKASISLGIRKDIGSDILKLKTKVLAVVDEFNAGAPGSVKIVSPVDGPQFIERQLSVLKQNGLLGFIIVFLLLWYFLGFRTSSMVAVGLPLAYFGTLIVLSYMGISIDLLSIIGMILVVGILVDDAIIVSDRYAENLKKGLTPDTAAFETVKSLIKPVTGTVFTTVVAFSPLILIDNELSYFLYSIPLIVIIALILSYLECFFILPNHLAHFVKKEAPKPKFDIFKPLGELYEKTLKLGLRFRYVSLVFLTGFFALSIYIAAKKVQHKFDLNINAEKISVYLHLKKSSSLDDSVVSMKPVEDFLMSLPQDKIGDVVSSVGSIWDHGRERKGFRYIKISAYINKANRYPSKAKKSVLPEIKKFLKAYKMKNKNVEKLYANYEKEGDDKENKDLVTVKVKGAENVNFKELENEIVSKVQPLDIVSEFIENTGMYINTWEFIPSSQLLLRYGVSSKQLSSQLRSYFVQDRLDEVRINGENVVLYTEIEKEKKPKLAQLDAFEVQSSKGLSVPLKFLGQWHEKQTLREVKHYDGQRSLNLDFKFDEKKGNVELAKQNIEKSLVSIKAKYPTYDISVKNSDENAKKQSAWAMQVALVCILAVLFVISLVLGSVSQALLVGLPIPFGVMGIVWALYLHDLPLGLMALVGLVGTIGVSVNASIVMVDHINQLKKENAGVFSQGQLIVGAASRLRPILLTTVTTLLGVFPMAYSFGGESGFTQPLAFSIGWGLSFSTLLTLVFLPALLLVLEDIKSLWFKLSLRIFKNKSVAVDFKSKILVEPHYKEQVKPAAALDDGGEVPRDLH